MRLMRRTAKYAWQGYKTNEDILSGLEINPVVKKIQSHRNKWIQHVRRKDRDRLAHLTVIRMSTVLKTKPRTALQKTSRLLMGPRLVMRPTTLQAIWWWWWWWWWWLWRLWRWWWLWRWRWWWWWWWRWRRRRRRPFCYCHSKTDYSVEW